MHLYLFQLNLFKSSHNPKIFLTMDHIGGDPLTPPSYSKAKRIIGTQPLPYQLGRNTLENSNIHETYSFFLALVDQLSDPEIRITTSERAQEYYKTPVDPDKMAKNFRSAVIDFCCNEFTHNPAWQALQSYKFLDIMHDSYPQLLKYEKTVSGGKMYKCGSCHACFTDHDALGWVDGGFLKGSKGVDDFADHVVDCRSLDLDQAWTHLVHKMMHNYKFPAIEVFIRATALFFEKDIVILEEGTNYRIPGALTGVSRNPPMVMVHMSRTKFQSAFRKLPPSGT